MQPNILYLFTWTINLGSVFWQFSFIDHLNPLTRNKFGQSECLFSSTDNNHQHDCVYSMLYTCCAGAWWCLPRCCRSCSWEPHRRIQEDNRKGENQCLLSVFLFKFLPRLQIWPLDGRRPPRLSRQSLLKR